MTYDEALERLAALGPELRVGRAADGAAVSVRRKFSLDHIRALLGALGEPQKEFASVLIAGTNGKGSTASTLASIANAAGIRTGLYTSPHLLRVNERIKISADGAAAGGNLSEIPDADFGRVYGLVDAATARLIADGGLPHYPSFFELLTAIAFVWFAEQGVELAVVEVGLGGRLDATNSVEPMVSVITDIGIDHTEYLGNTIREIAGEKAGILRQDGVLVTLAQHPEANAAIGEAAVRLGVRGVDAARCLPPSRDFAARFAAGAEASLLARNVYDLAVEGEALHVDSPLAGQHQQRNVALAIATALELRANQRLVDGRPITIANSAIEQGIRETQWPGRLEWIASRKGQAPLLLDVAHNPAGAWTLRAAISQLPEGLPRTLIFGCLADKQIDEMEQVLLPLFDSTSGDPARARDHVILAPVHNPRAATIEELAAAARRLDVAVQVATDLGDALEQAHALTPKDGVIVATGSIFLVAEIRALALTQAG
ncbi:MAG TPA: folylpolyglutamate synthase/dihydrofolate synthase family protein [Acidobacteriaceae bacterium]|nr:folylpolyglutamate synthase/dihydrofolate synthase family protein [Acidobacteriaceae bacterium]